MSLQVLSSQLTLIETEFGIHLKLYNIDFHSVIISLISCNPKEWMSSIFILLLNVTFLFLYHEVLTLKQTTNEVNPHSHIAPRVICHLIPSHTANCSLNDMHGARYGLEMVWDGLS